MRKSAASHPRVVPDHKAGKRLNMIDKAEQKDNFDHILTHLKDGSLAARLVQAYRKPTKADPMESMRIILLERLEQVRGSIDNHKT